MHNAYHICIERHVKSEVYYCALFMFEKRFQT